MPRNVRNFWIEGLIDGRESNLVGGPKSKDGGFDIDIYQRDNGAVTNPLVITGRAFGDTLSLAIYTSTGEQIFEHTTKR